MKRLKVGTKYFKYKKILIYHLVKYRHQQVMIIKFIKKIVFQLLIYLGDFYGDKERIYESKYS